MFTDEELNRLLYCVSTTRQEYANPDLDCPELVLLEAKLLEKSPLHHHSTY